MNYTPLKSSVKNIAVRKSLHFLIAASPFIAAFNYPLIIILLCAGTVFYGFVESSRFYGGRMLRPVQAVIKFASHRRDKERFVLGPLTLGAGALFVLIFFDSSAAAAGIFALAAGDGLAGLTGMFFGRLRPKFLHGKSIEGSVVCFAAITFFTFLVTKNINTAICCGIVGSITEALPIEDFDNVLLPVFVASTASIL